MANPKFKIGIVMAGAVSAGAYTGGVIDYLLEALQAWEVEKEKNRAVLRDNKDLLKDLFPKEGKDSDDHLDLKDPSNLSEEQLDKLWQLKEKGYQFDVPMHDVVIEVLGGASAGAMTAAVATLALFKGVRPIHERVKPGAETHNMIYDGWVTMGDDEKNTLEKMCGIEDLQNREKRIPSLLNSKPVAQIGQDATGKLKNSEPGSLKSLSDYPYISEQLEVILSLCSLRGIPVDIRFGGDAEATDSTQGGDMHRMKIHKLYAHFGLGGEPHDHVIALDPAQGEDGNLDTLINCAIASGAFPFGLSSVQVVERGSPRGEDPFIESPPPEYLKAQISRMFTGDEKVVPDIRDEDFITTVVDGGTINNEPFDEVLSILKGHHEAEHVSATNGAASKGIPEYYALLMIDPFPSKVEETPFEPTNSVEKLLLPLFGAIREQAMVKEKQITQSFSLDHTRGLVKPKKGNQEYPIASGSLGGFGGFFNKAFREHDFFLGRRNCQSFLRKHFFIDNRILEDDSAYLFSSYRNCLDYALNPEREEVATRGLDEEKKNIYYDLVRRFAYCDQEITESDLESYFTTDKGNTAGYSKYKFPIIPDMNIRKASSPDPELNGSGAVAIPAELANPRISIEELQRFKKPFRLRIRAIIYRLISRLLFGKKKKKDLSLGQAELREQRKATELREQVKAIIRKNFKPATIWTVLLVLLALPFLLPALIFLLIFHRPVISVISGYVTEGIFTAVVGDFKKRGLLAEGKG